MEDGQEDQLEPEEKTVFNNLLPLASKSKQVKGGPQNRALFDLSFDILELGDFGDPNASGR